jgi:hypothetical protein
MIPRQARAQHRGLLGHIRMQLGAAGARIDIVPETTPSPREPSHLRRSEGGTAKVRLSTPNVEHLWSRADANRGKRWQAAQLQKRLKQAKPLPSAAVSGVLGNEEVRGSSPR